MAEPEKDLERLREEQAKEDADLLAELDKESKEFDKVRSYASKSFSRRTDCMVGFRDRANYESLPGQCI